MTNENRVMTDRNAGSRIPGISDVVDEKPLSVEDDLFISPDFRGRFVFRFCVFTLLGGLLFSGLILYIFSGTLTTTFENGRLLIREAHLSFLPGILYANLSVLFISIIMTNRLTGYVFNRIRRPFFRFQADIRQIAQGDLTRKIQHAPKDQTSVMADNINQMTSAFDFKIRDVEIQLKQIIDSADSMDVPEPITEKLIRLKRSINKSFIL